MPLEDLYKDLARWLKHKKCKVDTHSAPYSMTFYYEGLYGMIETKKHKSSKWRLGQKENIEFFNNWSWARGVYAENLEEVKAELEELLK